MREDYFTGLIRRYSPPSEPLPVTARLPEADTAGASVEAPGIRAYLFDVYGTLFTSASGDIGTLHRADDAPADSRARELLAPFLEDCGLPRLVSLFAAAVTAEHAKRREAPAGEQITPEVDVRKIWANILQTNEEAAADFALRFELSVNPVYPMPGLADMLGRLASAGIPLGIVSNAQFFTPLLFNAFLNQTPEALGFLPHLCVYSFREGVAKPSPPLFQKASRALAALGIRPHETLYMGNDMLNDIWAAKQAGFRTALFAGDGRSLRLRENDPRCAGLKPDFIVKSLLQLIE
ncbi:MAG: HAD family hydrolase [Spirochaetales bacterium]|jgi:putative hydrolase of the HAD superfamily|nr:HAD family hydrolase [Spirochaetales bacterium]